MQISTEVAKLPQSRFLPRPPGHDLPLRIDVPKFQPRGSVEWLRQHGLKGELGGWGWEGGLIDTGINRQQHSAVSRAIYTTAGAGPHTQLCSGWRRAGTVTAAIWTRLESEVLCLHSFKLIICLLYCQAKALCSRQQLTYHGMRAVLSRAPELSQAWLTTVPGQPV